MKWLVIDANLTILANYFKIHPDGELHIQNGGSLTVSANTKLTNTGIILDKTSDSNSSTAITIKQVVKLIMVFRDFSF